MGFSEHIAILSWTELICNKSLKQRRLVALNLKKQKTQHPSTNNQNRITLQFSFIVVYLFSCSSKRVYPNNLHTFLVALLKSDFLLTILCAWILFQNVSSQLLFQILFSCTEQERHDISMSVFSPKQQNCLRTACLILQQLRVRTLWLVTANIKGNYNVWPSTASPKVQQVSGSIAHFPNKNSRAEKKKEKRKTETGGVRIFQCLSGPCKPDTQQTRPAERGCGTVA